MKKTISVAITLFILSCAVGVDQDEVIREMAKRDVIEKLQLPEGTKFSDENIEITETNKDKAKLDITYLAKVTIKSQDSDGKDIVETYTLSYKKTGGNGSKPTDYELISFD